MEHNKPSRKERSFALGAGLTVLAGLGVWYGHVDATSPLTAYQERYVGDGDCLEGTSYDPDKGARLFMGEVAGQSILSVEADRPAVVSPPVLNFVVNETGFFSVELTPADHLTAGVLVDKCGLTGGT